MSESLLHKIFMFDMIHGQSVTPVQKSKPRVHAFAENQDEKKPETGSFWLRKNIHSGSQFESGVRHPDSTLTSTPGSKCGESRQQKARICVQKEPVVSPAGTGRQYVLPEGLPQDSKRHSQTLGEPIGQKPPTIMLQAAAIKHFPAAENFNGSRARAGK